MAEEAGGLRVLSHDCRRTPGADASGRATAVVGGTVRFAPGPDAPALLSAALRRALEFAGPLPAGWRRAEVTLSCRGPGVVDYSVADRQEW